ncbi:MAG: 5'-Nucleotidase domain protein [Bacteroidetes bacterium]|nr:5'-Nucleotidase domain protein [Bacteroidota bacterium]
MSQIPNAGFENWVTDADTNYNPVGWQTTNSFPVVTVERFTPGFQGSYAMKVKTISYQGFSFPGVAILQNRYSFTQIPAKFSAYVKSTIMPGDQAFLIVALMKGDSVIASQDSCTFKINSTISSFTYVEFPIKVQSALVPDSLLVMVASGLGSGQVGTEIIVDQLAFIGGSATSVPEGRNLPGAFLLSQNYPNPFNPETVIDYQLPVAGQVSLKVYDLLGREMATLVDTQLLAGRYKSTWNAAGAGSGIYFYQLRAGDFVQWKKLVLLK